MSARTATSPTAANWSPAFKPIAPLVFAVIGFLMLAGYAIAQDPPGRVGRLSDAGGTVFLAPDDGEGGWQPVGINYPVTVGDNVWVGPDGRAEIDYGGGQLRLAQEANVHFSQLDERIFSAFLANGRASLRLRMLESGEVAKLDTPNAQIDLLRPGTYRLDTSADAGSTVLIVRDGEAEMRVGDRRVIVREGQTVSIQGSGPGAGISVSDYIGTDGFDQYALDRDRRIESGGQSEQYVSSSVPGVAELDAYGRWDTTPAYGAVWYPTAVAPNWTPYQDGSWTHVEPWGWTWVDNAPWGWVPFHYGRWVRIGPRWAWCPGKYERRPVYAPALVAWYGGAEGTSWSVGAGRPTYGWVPLSWGEPYWPHYRHSTNYWRRQNQYVAVDVRRVSNRAPQRYDYANARVPGAVMAAPADVLANRRPVGPNHYTVSAQQLAAAPVTTAALSVRPVSRSNVIDKLPPRAPETAGAFAARVRPDLRPASTSSEGAGRRNPATTGVPYGRPGVAGTPYTGQPASGSQSTPATPLPSTTMSTARPGSIQPIPQPQQPQQGSIQPIPQPGQSRPTGGQAATQPIPGSSTSINDPRGVGGQVYNPNARPQSPGVSDPRSVGGQVYTPNTPGNRPQPGVRQQPPEVSSAQPPTVNRPITQQPPSTQGVPFSAPQAPTMNRPNSPQVAAPQPMPATPSLQPIPATPQTLPSGQPAQNYQPRRPLPPGTPVQVPQQAPIQVAPQQHIPQQHIPQQYAPQQHVPVQRAPANVPVAPAPSSIAPAPSSIAPAPQSIAPAGGSVAVPQR